MNEWPDYIEKTSLLWREKPVALFPWSPTLWFPTTKSSIPHLDIALFCSLLCVFIWLKFYFSGIFASICKVYEAACVFRKLLTTNRWFWGKRGEGKITGNRDLGKKIVRISVEESRKYCFCSMNHMERNRSLGVEMYFQEIPEKNTSLLRQSNPWYAAGTRKVSVTQRAQAELLASELQSYLKNKHLTSVLVLLFLMWSLL